MCGLKPYWTGGWTWSAEVTPFVGVWIETNNFTLIIWEHRVTPFVGVWIETLSDREGWRRPPCHTLRGCVDWNLTIWKRGRERERVTPFVGVWIETYLRPLRGLRTRRHTLRGCVDWNRPKVLASKNPIMSHPSWVCGLKRRSPLEGWVRYAVTPFVGVWIETPPLLVRDNLWWVTPFVGVWIETRQRRMRRMPFTVTPFVGVWIETIPCVVATSTVPSHPLWVCGLKLSK